jgi:hypothetical protein
MFEHDGGGGVTIEGRKRKREPTGRPDCKIRNADMGDNY